MLYINQHDGHNEAENIQLAANLVREARDQNLQIFFRQDELAATFDPDELEGEWEEMGEEHQENILARAH